jgi:3D (Asp-Asp-Asp) domain-containing protein
MRLDQKFLTILSPAAVLLFTATLWAEQPLNGIYTATAYAQAGTTAAGLQTHRHIVAADPAILPAGTRIKIKHAGRYSGEYVVADTGEKIEGRKLDIFIPSDAVCKQFGVKRVRVKVIELGDGTHAAAKEADHQVKADVAQDLAKKAVGNAATEADWKAKAASTAGDKAATKPKDSSTPGTPTSTSTNPPPEHPPS